MEQECGDIIIYWFYSDILSEKDCDVIVDIYDSKKVKKQKSVVVGNILNTDVRDCENVLLPTYKGIGAILTSAGIHANYQAWKFDIERSNQCEFLKYSVNGKFHSHIDTTMQPKEVECRKLTVLAFLNDNFEGGKFFIENSFKKLYPPQKKGTVIVFPSFLLHGVEPITKGTRYSIVTWIVGPWFK